MALNGLRLSQSSAFDESAPRQPNFVGHAEYYENGAEPQARALVSATTDLLILNGFPYS